MVTKTNGNKVSPINFVSHWLAKLNEQHLFIKL